MIYLLPFFEPGFTDTYTGEDVRKGKLGSVYAVRDFFRIDPQLVTPPGEADFLGLISEGLIQDYDLLNLLDGRQQVRLRRVGDFNNFRSFGELEGWVGESTLRQLVGRAELRRLARRAHELGKLVIFDLVLMQTSRDCPLIEEHRDWYVLDDMGWPRIHQIAWLVYSDVALLDLPFNKPLQNYLSAVAPFWIQTCELDGVRIDASQTVDRPFLKQIKNRINAVKPDAIVVGETLCDLNEAKDVTTDMVYALLVDFHRDADRARPYVEFLEHTSGTFAPRTVAVAYFENHDSPRATRVWRERYAGLIAQEPEVARIWKERAGGIETALWMALIKNIQASVINATAGTASFVNLAYALEMGTIWGEEIRTEFEHPTLLNPEQGGRPPYSCLARAYQALHGVKKDLRELRDGHIYFHRNEFEGGDPDDRVLACTRHTSESRLLIAHNLDACRARCVICPLIGLEGYSPEQVEFEVVFDTYSFFFEGPPCGRVTAGEKGAEVTLEPLQSLMVRVRAAGKPPKGWRSTGRAGRRASGIDDQK